MSEHEAADERSLPPATEAGPEAGAESAESPLVSGTPSSTGVPPAVGAEVSLGSADPKATRKPVNSALARAFRSHRTIEGQVIGVIKGGYEVRVGAARGFCPHSQIDVQREEQPERHVGQSYAFRVTQLRRGGEDAVLSRRAAIEDSRADETKAVRATLVEGAVMEGRVSGLADFGAFVDLGAGVMGLAHISEISHARVRRVADALQVGDKVPVKILRIETDSGRISLSLRQACEDPWAEVVSRFALGAVYPGAVLRHAEFGAFVELAPGVEALAPVSELPPFPEGWPAALPIGTKREWHILDVDPKQRRIAITLPESSAVRPDEVVPQALIRGRVQRVERFGVFVWLAPGRVGLMPRVLCGAGAEEDLAQRFPVGDPVEVRVVELGNDRRIRLALPGVETPEAAAPARAPGRPPARPFPARPQGTERGAPRRNAAPRRVAEPPSPPAEATFGTSLADKLKAALHRRN